MSSSTLQSSLMSFPLPPVALAVGELLNGNLRPKRASEYDMSFALPVYLNQLGAAP